MGCQFLTAQSRCLLRTLLAVYIVSYSLAAYTELFYRQGEQMGIANLLL